jgi:hypothetical protein
MGNRLTTFLLPATLAHLDLSADEWLRLAYYRLSGLTNDFYPAPKP